MQLSGEIVHTKQKLHRWTSQSFVIANFNTSLGAHRNISSSIFWFLDLIQHPERMHEDLVQPLYKTTLQFGAICSKQEQIGVRTNDKYPLYVCV